MRHALFFVAASATLLATASAASADCQPERVKAVLARNGRPAPTAIVPWDPKEGGSNTTFCLATTPDDDYVVKYFADRSECAAESVGYGRERARQAELLDARGQPKRGESVPPVPRIVSALFADYVGSDADDPSKDPSCSFTVSVRARGTTLSKLGPLALPYGVAALGRALGALHRQTVALRPQSDSLEIASWTAINPPDPTFGNFVYEHDDRGGRIKIIDWARRSELTVAQMLDSAATSIARNVPEAMTGQMTPLFDTSSPAHLAALLDAIMLSQVFWTGYAEGVFGEVAKHESLDIPVDPRLLNDFKASVMRYRSDDFARKLRGLCTLVLAQRCNPNTPPAAPWPNDQLLCTECAGL